MQRRRFLLPIATVAAASALSACGFRLRGNITFPFSTLYLSGNERSRFVRQLRRTLEGAGLKVLVPPSTPDMAERTLVLLGENRESVIVSRSASGSVREVQLRLTIRYQVNINGAEQMGDDVALQQSRDLNYDETQALAKEEEEEVLFHDMENDIIAQILRRLQAPK